MRTRTVVLAAALLACAAAPARAGSHLWDIVEVFSNADGTIQYIELEECCGATAENNIANKHITSQATGNDYVIPSNVAGSTANKSLLFATAAFAALPGAPTPDFTIPDNFFSVAGDTLRYGVNPPASTYDTWTFGAVPTDGCTSLHRQGAGATSGVNTPKNYSDVEGTVYADPADVNGDLAVNVLDLIDLLLCFGQPAAPDCQAEDVNGDGNVNVLDLIQLLLSFGTSCP